MTELNRIFITLLLSGSLIPSAVFAQEQPSSVMTLQECMEYAVSNSTKMRIQAADRSDEQWQRRQAIMQAFTPSLSASTSAYSQFGRNLDPETNVYQTVTSFHNEYNVSAGITFFDGFQAVNNLKMASTSVKMGASKEQMERDRICLATMEAFSNVIYYSEMEKVVADQVETAKTTRDRAVRQEELGQKGHADVVQMDSELAQKEYLLISTTNEKNDALITLKDVMFWPADEELLLDTDINEPLCTEVDIALMEMTAKSFLPSAQIASFNVVNATLDLKSARGAYSPSLGLSGGWSTTYYTYPGRTGYSTLSFGEQFRNNSGEYIQLSLNIPIFDQLRRRTTLHQKKSALARAEAQYDQTMRDIENEVRRAMNDRDGALAAFHQAERLADVQEEAYKLNSRRFEQGLISSLEYHTASETYLKACAERLGSLLKLRLKDSIVKYYNGIPYIEQFK